MSPNQALRSQSIPPLRGSGRAAELERQASHGIAVAIPAALKYIWAGPCTAVGALIGVLLCCIGASPRLVSGVLEVGFRCRSHPCASALLRLPFSAITFGHVVLAPTHECQAVLRPHERTHVAQYERWGVLFFGLYAASSLIQLLSGRRPYMDNHFELEARAHGAQPNAESSASEA